MDISAMDPYGLVSKRECAFVSTPLDFENSSICDVFSQTLPRHFVNGQRKRRVDEEMRDFDPYITRITPMSRFTNCPRIRTDFLSPVTRFCTFSLFTTPSSLCPPNSISQMSGAAASAGASKFTAFMNHPAACGFRLRSASTRTQDRLLLGTNDEVVLGGRWYQRLDSASREIERVQNIGQLLRWTVWVDQLARIAHKYSRSPLDSMGEGECLRLGDMRVPRVSDLLPAIAAIIPRTVLDPCYSVQEMLAPREPPRRHTTSNFDDRLYAEWALLSRLYQAAQREWHPIFNCTEWSTSFLE
ncbi:hypothetical protein IMY05_C4685000600 [Salix suchowensis]|nr:hypothetical protein IMY05_C4685000600 [Salix suchowensis]